VAVSPTLALLLAAALAALVAWQLGKLLLTRGQQPDGSAPSDGAELAGGLALALALTLGLLAVELPAPYALGARWVVLGGALVLLAGLWRDAGRGVRGQAAASVVFAAILAVALGGVRVVSIKLPFGGFVDLGAAGAVLTVVWITAVALAVRWLDPLPGLPAGFGFEASLTFLLVGVTRGQAEPAAVASLTLALAAVVAGACGGLLAAGGRSRPLPLGRGGAGLLGYLLGVLTVVGTLKNTAFLLLALPALALAVPLANLAYMRRQWLRAGRGDPNAVDRARSLGEMLSRRGFTHARSVELLLGLQAYCCLVALALVGLVTVPVIVKLLLLALLLPLAFGAFFLLTRVAARVAATHAGKVDILGVSIDALTYDSALERMDAMIAGGGAHHVFTADVSGIMRAREDAELAEIVRTCDLVTADGAGVLWAARLFDFPLPERVSGVDLVRRLCALAADKGYRVYLLGAAPGVAEAAGERLRAEHPGLDLCGIHDGYFTDEQEVVELLRAARPHILFVALGIPKQEQFIRRWYRELDIPLCLGIGGSFDVISGRLERAPLWMQRAGLEWLFRVKQEPKRWRRLAALPKFVGLIAVSSWRAWRRGKAETP
jgi:N-acetylglucosaminyldiphosphoundecaprenol N-acetyl-beta-D-mannosaminyltransferase